jgi:cyclic-di-AMP phosphodiesterase PgpH
MLLKLMLVMVKGRVILIDKTMNFIDSTSNKISEVFKKLKLSGKSKVSLALLENRIFQRWAIAIILSLILAIILSPKIYFSEPTYRQGEIAPTNIKADRDFLVEDLQATRQKRIDAADNIKPIYDYDSALQVTIKTKLEKSFSSVNESYKDFSKGKALEFNSFTTQENARAKKMMETILGFTITVDEFNIFKENEFSNELLNKLTRSLASFYDNKFITDSILNQHEKENSFILRNIYTQKEETIDQSSILFLREIDPVLSRKINTIFKNEKPDLRKFAFLFLKKLVEPNLKFNKDATEKKKMILMEEVKPVYFQVQKNEMIVREGEKIGYPELVKLEAFHKSTGDRQFSGFAVMLGIFCTSLFLSLLLYFWRTRNWLKISSRSNIDFLVLSIAAIVQILFVKFGIFVSIAVNRAFPLIPADACYLAIPFAWGAMIIAVLINRNVALIITLLTSFLIAFLFDEKMIFPLFSFIGSIAASYHIVNSRQRSTFLKVGIFLGLINIASVICLNLLTGNLFQDLLLRSTMALFGGILTGILVAGIAPIFESIFGFITYIKLLELANLNQPLFQRMIIEAPGTYHHSIIVASLVEAAAEAIGTNALLAKVSAYYHDIGKLAKPHYYIENQPNYDNRHDKLSPKMSSLIIISHVKEGCELAANVKLGQPIINIIRQHHGTSIVSYFYDKAKKNKDESIRALPESDFRYPGPKPQTKEAGLVMLGDVIEASSRTLSNPTPARIRSLVRETIERIYMDGQLDECELTLKDLNTIAETFTRILMGIFHHRVDYPETIAKDTNGKKDNIENSNRK